LNILKLVSVYSNRKEIILFLFFGKTDKETDDDKPGTERGCSADLSALFYRIKYAVDANTQRHSGQTPYLFLPELPQSAWSVPSQGLLDGMTMTRL
jgi:hypothetical protein